ncbi:MAG: GIY-YIG nuclease family protein [Melioribacteraceae bacterium]|nr:GIY-YIG nuclease family protein [Melioribacteraceae bacterium]
MIYFTYILRSLKDGIHYYGSTSNLENRLKIHNSGKSKFTKGHRPWEIIYSEKFETRSDAMKREMFFKSIDGNIWLKKNNII